MFELEPGPSVRSALPLAPRVVPPGLFVALGATAVWALGAADEAFGGVVRDLSAVGTLEIDPGFDRDVAAAYDALGDLDSPDDARDLAAIRATIDAVVDDVAGQALDLPGPDASDPDLGIYTPPEPAPIPTTAGAAPRSPEPEPEPGGAETPGPAGPEPPGPGAETPAAGAEPPARFSGGVMSWSDADVLWAAAHPDAAAGPEWAAAREERDRRPWLRDFAS